MFFGAGTLSLDDLGRVTSEVSVADVVAVALAAGLNDSPGASLLGTGAADLTRVSVAGIVAVVLAAELEDLSGAPLVGAEVAEPTWVSVAGIVAVALAAELRDFVGASLLGMEAPELRTVSDLRVGSFQDFSFVSLLYQYFLPLTSYSFHGWLAGAATAFATGLLIGVPDWRAAVAPDFGAGPFAVAGTCAVGSFHDFSLVSLLYQYFFPILNCQKLI